MCEKVDWEEFLLMIDGFLEISKKVGDLWVLHGERNVLGGAYLVKREKRHGKTVRDTSVELSMEEESFDEKLKDCCAVDMRIGDRESGQFWEYHIVYSVCYGVPVIYFNAWRCGGKLLSLEEIWSEIPYSLKPSNLNRLWSMITQHEHPILGKPFFQVHPCGTSEMLSSLKELAGKNVLIPWLSSVGLLVNLKLDPQYAVENSKK